MTTSSAVSETGTSSSEAYRTVVSRCLLFIRNFGAGIVQDIRTRIPWYVSDWSDAWNYRVVPATTLIFFAKYDSSHLVMPA